MAAPTPSPDHGAPQKRAPLTPDQKRFRGLIRGAAKLRREPKVAAPEAGRTDTTHLDQRTEQLFGLFEERGFGTETTGISAASIASDLRGAASLDDCMALLDAVSQKDTNTQLADALDALDGRIEELLTDPALRVHATTILRQELARYRRAQPTVKRVAKLERSVEVAAKLRAAIAARALRTRGAIIGSDTEAIAKLTTTELALSTGRDTLVTKADDRTLGFLNARTLLDYRKQLQEKGFAETPSRRALQEKLRTALAAGKKVLLAGATGTGKTQLAVYEVELHSGGAEVASGHEAMTTGELYGKKILATDADGNVETRFSMGPRTRALERAGFVFDEVDTVNNRTLMRMKRELNLRPGQETAVQENGEETLIINANFSEVWTANLLSAKHPERVDMDAAILRLFDSLEVGFMPASEVRDLMLASIADPSGAIPLSVSEIQLLTRFAEAAEQTQKAYNGEPTVLRAAKGEGKDQLGKVFLDPGRVFTMMKEWPVAKATGTTLAAYLKMKLEDFLAKPEFKAVPDDRVILAEIFEYFDLLSGAAATQKGERPFTLPSELGFLTRAPKPQSDDLGLEEDATDGATGGAEVTEVGEANEAIEGSFGLAELSAWLKENSLDSKLEKSLEEFVQTYEQAYADGPMGFRLDRACLRFPSDPAKLAQLKQALEAGSVNGIIITAYPTDAEIMAMAPTWAAFLNANATARERALPGRDGDITASEAEATLRAMPVTTFLARHFEARGGAVYEDSDKRVETWGELRWEPTEEEAAAGHTTLSAVYRDAGNHEAAHARLKPQPTLQDLCGRTLLSFADTSPNPSKETTLLQEAKQGSDARIDAQGDDLSFERLMAADARLTDPTEALALIAAADPKAISRYPDKETWSWQNGITHSFAAGAFSYSDGAYLSWRDPARSGGNGRARSVLRGTPGFSGLDPTAPRAGGDLAGTRAPQGAPDLQAARERMDASPGLLNLEKAVQNLGEEIWEGRERFTVLQEIAASLNMLKDGPLGFDPDLTKLTFPTDAATLAQLKGGIRDGVFTGMLLTAYPKDADLPRLADALNAQEQQRVEEANAAGKTYEARTHTVESLKQMPVTEFLACHFEARGGKFRDRDNRIAQWSTLCWEPTATEQAAGRTTLSAVYAAATDHEAAYKALAPQATLGQVLGTSTLSFAHTRQEIRPDTKILQDAGSALKQGKDCRFDFLLRAGVTLPNPVEWLTLLGRCQNPADPATYPNPNWITWEWIGGLLSSLAAGAGSGSDGAGLRWDVPAYSGDGGRARSVLRGTPGF